MLSGKNEKHFQRERDDGVGKIEPIQWKSV